MMKRTFVFTGVTIAVAIFFVSFNQTEFSISGTRNSRVTHSADAQGKMIPEYLAGVYKGIKPDFLVNKSASANLSPDRKAVQGKKELHFILIETGIVWLSELNLRDSVLEHYEGSYQVTVNSGNTLEIKASFWLWNKTAQIYYIRFDRPSNRAWSRAEGEPEFELEYIK